jgi:hypothetical protein
VLYCHESQERAAFQHPNPGQVDPQKSFELSMFKLNKRSGVIVIDIDLRNAEMRQAERDVLDLITKFLQSSNENQSYPPWELLLATSHCLYS